MAREFCPQCGGARTGSFRFCRSCGFDFDEAVPTAPELAAKPPTRVEAVGQPRPQPAQTADPILPPPTAWVSPPEVSKATSPTPAAWASAPTQRVPTVAPVPATSIADRPAGRSMSRRKKFAFTGVGLVVALAALASLGSQQRPEGDLAAANASASISTLEPTAEPSLDAAIEPTAELTPEPTPEPTPDPTPAPTPKPKPVSYAKLSDRTWAKVVKSPDRYLGKTFVVYACVTQFDAATGDDTFRGQGSNKRREYWFSDGDNAMFTGTATQLNDIVTDDVVVMNVRSLGSYSYDTQIGGNTTVPRFQIDKITRKGSCAI
jgi:hypothetical protein